MFGDSSVVNEGMTSVQVAVALVTVAGSLQPASSIRLDGIFVCPSFPSNGG